MYKALTLTFLALATVTAQSDSRFLLASVNATLTSTTCRQSKTAETCNAVAGYCCASGNNATATVGVCVPAEFSGVPFRASGSNVSTTFTCTYRYSGDITPIDITNICTSNDNCTKGLSGFGLSFFGTCCSTRILTFKDMTGELPWKECLSSP